MSESIIIALITGGLSFAGVIVSNFSSNKKLVENIKLEITAYHASTDEKIKTLTEEVKKHNNFAQRMPVVENEIKHLQQYHKN